MFLNLNFLLMKKILPMKEIEDKKENEKVEPL
jgi:hypothetical protein